MIRRLDSSAWTSHRAYLGRDSVSDWLTIDVIIKLFGGRSNVHKFVRSVHTKAIEYPADFDPDTGLFKKKAITKRIQRANQPVATASQSRRFQPAEKILDEVCQMTGVKRRELTRAVRGPGANPARRLAIWALSYAAGLTHKEIAMELKVPFYQVSRLLSRIRKEEQLQPLRMWMDVWRSKS
ncbi:MAG: sigma-70 family RNA polymerase sigma factor [Deltaproteobacteria bacterium]|nr:sigma-70 family RNA polymerase sigma factor [Deltaproteobacteria bacterium]